MHQGGQPKMDRRDLLSATTGAAILAAPAIA
jgi:hypothetical protein